QSMSNYPFKDNYTAAIEREHQRSLVQLKKLKDATIKRIKKDNSFLRKYLNYHYELIAFNIQTRYTLRDYDQYIQYFNNDTLLLATELPDIITGLLYNHYIKLRNDSIKYAALDSIEGIINTTRLSAVTTRRMNTGYFALLTDIKAYKRIDKIVSSHTYLPHGSCNIITGNKISLTGKTIAEPHAPTRLSDFKKKYNVVFIWSTDCGHCKRSIESLNELYKQSNNKPVQFYSYTIGNYDSAIVNRLEWRLKSTLNNGWHNPFITNFRINYTPLILVLNAQGIALAQPNDIETLQAILAELLN
ncbi:MAG: TlpA family protein disulfide reductase, partial [Bacteroidota bacterium]